MHTSRSRDDRRSISNKIATSLFSIFGIFATTPAHGQCPPTFAPPHSYGAGTRPQSAALADLNTDGRVDLVITNRDSDSISIFLATPAPAPHDGTFQPPVTYATGDGPSSVAAADFNNDTILDLAVPNDYARTLSIFRGNGDGTFQAPTLYTTASQPYDIVIADFNADTRPDLAIANLTGNSISIFRGNIDGTFQTRLDFPVASNVYSLAAADMNADGILDIVASGALFVDTLRGNGNATFQTAVSYPIIGGGESLAVGDFNNDDRPDVVIAIINRDNFIIMLANPGGTLQPAVEYPTGQAPISVATTDFNDDDQPDVVIAHAGDSFFSTYLGNPDGTFQPATDFPVGNSAESVTAGDLNADDHPDLIIPVFDKERVLVLLYQNPTLFEHPAPSSPCPIGAATFGVVAGGTDPLGYQWQRETAPGSNTFVDLADGPTGSWDGAAPGVGAIVSGATTPDLTIAADTANARRLAASHELRYRVVVTNECGSITSDAAALSVCPADFNCDDLPNSQDFFDFLDAFFASAPDADFNTDGVINSQDFFDFLAVFLAGCQ